MSLIYAAVAGIPLVLLAVHTLVVLGRPDTVSGGAADERLAVSGEQRQLGGTRQPLDAGLLAARGAAVGHGQRNGQLHGAPARGVPARTT